MTRRPLHWTLLVVCALLSLGAGSDSVRFAFPNPAPRLQWPPDALFHEDFSNGMSHWVSDREGVWSVTHGMLRADLPDEKQLRSFLYAGDPNWTDVAVELDVCQMRGVDKGVVVRVDGESGIGADLRGPGYHDLVLHRREWPLGRVRVINGNGVWHHMRIEARDHTYRVFVNGELVLERTDSRRARPKGRIALPAYTGGVGQCTVYYDNIVVTALGQTASAQR